jgi:ribosomal protein S6--L-glutamate ligase
MTKPTVALWMYQDLGGDIINHQLSHLLQKAGIQVLSHVDLPKCVVHQGKIWTPRGENLSAIDVFYQMNADDQSVYQNKLLRILEMQGVYIINTFSAFNQAKDKLLGNTILKQMGIKTPAAIGLGSGELSEQIEVLVQNWQGILLKPRGLHGGKSIVKWVDFNQLKDGWDLIKDRVHQYYLEEYIDFGDHDYRVEIIAGKFAGGYSRMKAHPFKTNISAQGGLMGIATPDACKVMAQKAVEVLHLHCSIVDLVRSSQDNQYYILEVNPALGVFNEAAIKTGTQIFYPGEKSYKNDQLKLHLLSQLIIHQVKQKLKNHATFDKSIARNSILSKEMASPKF